MFSSIIISSFVDWSSSAYVNFPVDNTIMFPLVSLYKNNTIIFLSY